MRDIWQQDALRYLAKRNRKKNVDDPGLAFGLRVPLNMVRTELNLGGDDSRLSNFVNRHRNSAYSQPFSASAVVKKLVSPLIRRGDIDPERELENFHAFLRAEGIKDKWLGYTDYEQCLIAAFTEALRRHAPTEDTKQAVRVQNQRLQPYTLFTGREEELKALESVLSEHGSAVLYGIGGIGKTVLAEEYARRSSRTYASCQVITAEPWMTSFDDIVGAVRFSGAADGSAAFSSIKDTTDRLRSLDSSALLIFDNIDNLVDGKEQFEHLIQDSEAHIIVTTRSQGAFDGLPCAEVTPLTGDEQIDLLLRETGLDTDSDELEAAEEICRAVDGHTLIIQLLGRAIRAEQISCAQMLSRMRSLTGFSAFDAGVRIHKDDFNRSVRIRDFISDILFNLAPLEDDERDLLRFLTLLPFSGIPKTLLISDPFSLDPASLERLESRGWIDYTPSTDMIRLHPVVREAILSSLDVSIETCRPFLSMLADALWEPEASVDFPYLLSLASSTVDILYISEPLRGLLVSDRVKPLLDKANGAVPGSNTWQHLQRLFTDFSEDEELMPYTAATLHMYALFCECMHAANSAAAKPGRSRSFYESADAWRAFCSGGMDERLQRIMDEFAALFTELNKGDLSEAELALAQTDPDSFLQSALVQIGAEITDYLEETQLLYDETEEAAILAGAFSELQEADMKLLTALSETAYSSFLVTALEALSVGIMITPLVASEAVVSLTLLLRLLHRGSEHVRSFKDALEYRGWAFPEITYVPEEYSPAFFSYREVLWGMPEATQSYHSVEKDFAVSIRLTQPDDDTNDCVDDCGCSAQSNLVQGEAGQWSILVSSRDGTVPQDDLVRIARGIV